MCCKNGKIAPPTFPDHPEPLKQLWESNHPFSAIFLKYSRQINNSLAMACLKVMHPPGPPGHHGWQPTVTIQGKVSILMGGLQPEEGQEPKFAQLYVTDPDHAHNENEIRLATVILPKSVTNHEKQVLLDLIDTLQQHLKRCNPYVHDFKMAYQILSRDNPQPLNLVLDERKRPTGEHSRRYNLGLKEISVLMSDETVERRSFSVLLEGGGVRQMFDTHRSTDPLHFVTLFPTGADGWHLDRKQEGGVKNMSPLQFYCFHIQHRLNNPNILLRGNKLFHEYLCVMYAKVENQRLLYIQQNQQTLRSEKYRRICEDVSTSNNPDDIRSGRKVILPPSFTGSPRYLHQHFQNAVAIAREYHKPDLFITFTCNPQWPEIIDSLLPNQQPQDRPDIVARVFNLKRKELMNDLTNAMVMGRRSGNVDVVEFQKRGLPHCHILLILNEQDRLHTAHDVDQVITAELPPDPNTFPVGPQREQARLLEQFVVNNMVHNCTEVCRQQGSECQKGFPKQYSAVTHWDDNAFYPTYMRRSPGDGGRAVEVGNKTIDNRWIVPYNPYLLLKYQAHINVEACVSPMAAKYLFKYVTKGSDRAMATLQDEYNEVKEYQNLRSIGASEACWRLFEFGITNQYPAVQALRVHLDGEQYITFEEGQEPIVAQQEAKSTELTSFFEYNATHPETQVKYVDFPKHFVWKNNQWNIRQRGHQGIIGRVHTVHPLSGDEFYLRIVLHHDHCKGKQSFRDLLTVNNINHESYKAVCRTLGLLQDDEEWNIVLREASLTKLCPQIRSLFVTLLLFCEPSSPLQLFNNHVEHWWDDFKRQLPTATEHQLRVMVLDDIEKKLLPTTRSLDYFGLLRPTVQERQQVEQLTAQQGEYNQPMIIQEELEFNFEDLKIKAQQRLSMLTPSQRIVADRVLQAVSTDESFCVFLNARGGTGKTFLLNTLLATVRTMADSKQVALAVASSGIAATLLLQGRTFHSRFKAALKPEKDSTLFIRPTDTLSKLIKMSKLIIWDEAPMSHRFHLEALDRTLKDIATSQQPFGGKCLILAGDYRQILPVVPRGSRANITAASMKKSPLWRFFTVFELNENMRIGQDQSLQHFDRWLLKLGNGELRTVGEPDSIQIPPENLTEIQDDSRINIKESLMQFVEKIFPDIGANFRAPEQQWISWIAERAILTPKNRSVDEINAIVIQDLLPGEAIVLSSADSTCDPKDSTRFPIEFLNKLTPAGLPPHRLYLKKGMVLMLLRNLSPKQGLCNGTRLILTKVSNILLNCKIASGDHAGEEVLIPRINIMHRDELFIDWNRRQFPVRPAFAMTINKSQGQTFKTVGVWLEEAVFTHGQLYVAASRVGNPHHLHFAVNKSAEGKTRNVVYKEVL